MNSYGKICVAGLIFDMQQRIPVFDEFVCHSEKSDGRICCVHKSLFGFKHKQIAKHDDIDVYITQSGEWFYTVPWCSEKVQVSLSPDYKTIGCYLAPCEDEAAFYPVMRVLFRMAFESIMAHNSRLSLHSACVEVDGEALCFTGASGMGKSTRANSWIEALGAEFISGDRPALALSGDGVTAYGVPWDGKEQIFRSVKRPLKAVLDVRRSDSDYLRKLSVEQAQKLLAKQVFIPMWDTNAAVSAIFNSRKLAKSVPVYRVFCGPDADNAKNIYNILFNIPDRILEAAKDMQIKSGFVLRRVADEFIVMPTGENIAEFDGAVALNEVSAFIFEKLANPVSKEDLVIALCNEYEVDAETAAKDVDALISKFEDMGIIE